MLCKESSKCTFAWLNK